ncbi:hypothetical protein KFU94_39255 [Chloroflexi bacterium TSY]|nr:hypothetical protein [Chloroflexi bacterium TSY]
MLLRQFRDGTRMKEGGKRLGVDLLLRRQQRRLDRRTITWPLAAKVDLGMRPFFPRAAVWAHRLLKLLGPAMRQMRAAYEKLLRFFGGWAVIARN